MTIVIRLVLLMDKTIHLVRVNIMNVVALTIVGFISGCLSVQENDVQICESATDP
jgi:hypothetical protein